MKTSKPEIPAGQPHPVIHADHCKGCGRCIEFCPGHVLRYREKLNRRGVQPAEYTGSGCTGCAVCFYNCPEPFAIEVVANEPRNKKG